MLRSRRDEPAAAAAVVADTSDRAQARAVVGITGDKQFPAWKASTTLRTRKRIFALQATAASEAVGTVALILLLPVVAQDRHWSSADLALTFVLAVLAYAVAAIYGVERFSPQRRVRVVQFLAFNGAVFTVLCGLLPVLPITILFVVARSASYGLQVSSFRPLVYDAAVPEARVRVFARVAIGALFGAGVGAILAAAAVGGPNFGDGNVIIVAGVVAAGLASLSLRLTEPGIGGVEPARMERAFGGSEKLSALRMPMRDSVGRVLQVHTVRTSLTSYVAIGALSFVLIHPWVVVMESLPGKMAKGGVTPPPLSQGAIFAILSSVLFSLMLVTFTVGQGMEKNRRRTMRMFIRTGWLDPGTIGGFCALQLAFISFHTSGAGPVPAVLGVGLVGGTITKIALDVSTMSVVSAEDRPAVAVLTNFSWAMGAILCALIVPWNASATSTGFGVVRTGFAILFVALVLSVLAGRRLAQQPDADLDAVLPISAAVIVAETPSQELTGLAPEVSPYAYVAPPAAVLDAAGLPPLLSAEQLNFAYGSVPVLFDVNLTVGAGELVAVLGPNGVGKTTLLRCLSGLEVPQQGVVRFNGDDVTRTPASRRVSLGLSQIVGGNAVFGTLSVAENLQMYGFSATKDRKAVADGIARAYEVFPRLADRRNQLGSTLSGGEQQMLGLSKALILRPRLLVVQTSSRSGSRPWSSPSCSRWSVSSTPTAPPSCSSSSRSTSRSTSSTAATSWRRDGSCTRAKPRRCVPVPTSSRRSASADFPRSSRSTPHDARRIRPELRSVSTVCSPVSPTACSPSVSCSCTARAGSSTSRARPSACSAPRCSASWSRRQGCRTGSRSRWPSSPAV